MISHRLCAVLIATVLGFAAGCGDAPVGPDTATGAAVELPVPPLRAVVALDGASGPDALSAAQRALERWVSAASRLTAELALMRVHEALADGRALLGRARAAAERGDYAAATEATLAAADRLAATTPSAVAHRLVLDARASRAEWQTASPERRASKTFRRADRLVRGAGEALAEDRYVLAIRRAYYARQLLRRD